MVAGNAGRFASSRFSSSRFNGGRFGIGDPWSRYRAGGRVPKVVADFRRRAYRTRNGAVNRLADLATFSRAGLATMTDSDGRVKWAPHNYCPASDNMTSALMGPEGAPIREVDGFTATAQFHGVYIVQSLPLIPGVQYTVEFRCFRNSGSNLIHIATNNGLTPASFTPNATETLYSLTFVLPAGAGTVCIQDRNASGFSKLFIRNIRVYRSDQGGMVNNPDTGDSYIPTTSGAVFLPRVGHHVWNGSAWVNKGLLIESEARTNILTPSVPPADVAISRTITTNAIGDPNGGNTASLLTMTQTGGGGEYRWAGNPHAVNTTYSAWALLRRGTARWARLRPVCLSGTPSVDCAWFDIENGVLGTRGTGITTSGMLRFNADYWLCWITYTTPATITNNLFDVGVADADGSIIATAGLTLGIYHVQVEVGSVPSSLIPTTSAAVTRAAETLSIPAANMAYSATAMSFAIEGEMNYADRNLFTEVQPIYIDGGPGTYILQKLLTDAGTGGFQASQGQNSVPYAAGSNSPSSRYTPGIGVQYGWASRNGITFIQGATEGVLHTLNSAPSAIPAITSANCQLGHTFMGTIRAFRQWDEDIGDAGITAASLPLAA